MTPLEFAENLAKSTDRSDLILGVAMVTRGLSDDDPANFRAGWPLDAHTVRMAAQYLRLGSVSEDFVDEVLMLAPTLSDAILNKGA